MPLSAFILKTWWVSGSIHRLPELYTVSPSSISGLWRCIAGPQAEPFDMDHSGAEQISGQFRGVFGKGPLLTSRVHQVVIAIPSGFSLLSSEEDLIAHARGVLQKGVGLAELDKLYGARFQDRQEFCCDHRGHRGCIREKEGAVLLLKTIFSSA